MSTVHHTPHSNRPNNEQHAFLAGFDLLSKHRHYTIFIKFTPNPIAVTSGKKNLLVTKLSCVWCISVYVVDSFFCFVVRRKQRKMFAATAPSLLHVDETSIHMVVNKISQLKSFWSPEVLFYHLPWQIQLTHRNATSKLGSDNTLAVHLHSLDTMTTDWSCAAMAEIELQSFDVNVRPLTNVIGPWVFNARESSWSRNKFILWTELFNRQAGYVKNDQIRMNIKIAVQFLTRLPNAGLIYHHIFNAYQIHFRIENVRSLMAASSESIDFSGLPWKVIVRKKQCKSDGHSYVGILLYCIPPVAPPFRSIAPAETSFHWTRQIFAEFRLNSSTRAAHIRRSDKTRTFSKIARCHGISNFIRWCDLMDPQNGHVQNNGIEITVNIRDETRDAECGIRTQHRNLPGCSSNIALATICHDVNANAADTASVAEQTGILCSICLDNMIGREMLSSSCGHVFCKDCILASIKIRSRCPNCQTKLDSGGLRSIYLS